MFPNLLQIRTAMVNFHVLRDASGLYLIDAGFIGGRTALHGELVRVGWEKEPIRGIIVTHGHLDHILNVGRIASETGAWIAAPREDAAHYAGHPEYHGISRITGFLERAGRTAFDFTPFVPDRWIEDGDFFDIWDGLRAVHLPGHTSGHTGFYCERRGLLLCADLFASFRWGTHLPPAIFNSQAELIPASIRRALALELGGVIPNHSDAALPAVHLTRLQKLSISHG